MPPPQQAPPLQGVPGSPVPPPLGAGVPAGDDLPAPRTGKVGEMLEGEGVSGEPVAWRLMSLKDPADEAFTAHGIGIPPGYRAVIVAALFTNKGQWPFQGPPDAGLVVVDDDGNRHGRATASLESHPPFRDGQIKDEETVAGHTYFVLPAGVTIKSLQWWPRWDLVDKVLTWLP